VEQSIAEWTQHGSIVAPRLAGGWSPCQAITSPAALLTLLGAVLTVSARSPTEPISPTISLAGVFYGNSTAAGRSGPEVSELPPAIRRDQTCP